jgi:hypothetical protein
MSSPEITTKVNRVLQEIKSKTNDGLAVTVKRIAQLTLGDLKFFTQSRFASNWLLEHKHEWTHLCDPSLITPPSTFPIILHSIPISFTPLNKSSLSELCKENRIHPDNVLSACWLGNPQDNKKSHGSIIVNFWNKNLARKIEKKVVFFIITYVLIVLILRSLQFNVSNVLRLVIPLNFVKIPLYVNIVVMLTTLG